MDNQLNENAFIINKKIIFAGFIIAKFFLQYFLYNANYDLHRDEYLHLDQGYHLAWGYQSIPPVTSWIAYIIHLLGNSEFWVKFFPSLFGAITIAVVWKTIDALKGNLFALILGSTCVLFSALLRINFLFQPNSLDVLCWTSLYYILIKYINSEKAKWLFVGSLVFAIGFLNKYNIVFLFLGLLPAVVLTEQRKIFTKKNAWASILFGLLLILPNLFWQYNNHFPVYYHLKELADTQLVNVNRWNFLKEQLFYFIGALPVIMAALYALLFYRPFKKYRLFFWVMIFSLSIFVYFKAKGYYAIGLYPIYIAFGSVYLGNLLHTHWKKYLQPIAIAIPIILYILSFNLIFSIKSPKYIVEHTTTYHKLGMLNWEDGKEHTLPQDYADMLGWKELAQKVDKVYNQLTNKSQTIILCDNYGQAGAINYYTKHKEIKAVSFNADYINWFNLETKIENFIRVKEFDGSKNELEKTGQFFYTAFAADSITNSFAREYHTTIFIFCHPKIDVNQILKAEVNERKNYPY